MSILASNNKINYDNEDFAKSLKEPNDQQLYKLPKDLSFAGCGNQICVMRKSY